MAFVKQRLKSDCGVACLAMLCDVTYEQAAKVIDYKYGKYKGTSTKQLREAAWRLGVPTRGTKKQRLKVVRAPTWWDKYIPPSLSDWWYLIPDNSLVKIKRYNVTGGRWHWVVWRKEKVYDPARGVFHPSKYGWKPSSYLEFVK